MNITLNRIVTLTILIGLLIIPLSSNEVVAQEEDGDGGDVEVQPQINVTLFNGSADDFWGMFDGVSTYLYVVCGIMLIVILVPIIALIVWMVKTSREAKYYKCLSNKTCPRKK